MKCMKTKNPRLWSEDFYFIKSTYFAAVKRLDTSSQFTTFHQLAM
jgi:hypothetical protein